LPGQVPVTFQTFWEVGTARGWPRMDVFRQTGN